MVTYFQPPTSKSSNVVDFPVVGETIKEADNVIDYNINPEITKDASSVTNANNDTTTGMANVIPGVNAPKLLESTSIINKGGGTIVEISDYTSIDEWQAVVDRVLAGEFVCVLVTYTPYSIITQRYLVPIVTTTDRDRVRFQSVRIGTQWVRANCWLTNGVITSVTRGNGSA